MPTPISNPLEIRRFSRLTRIRRYYKHCKSLQAVRILNAHATVGLVPAGQSLAGYLYRLPILSFRRERPGFARPLAAERGSWKRAVL